MKRRHGTTMVAKANTPLGTIVATKASDPEHPGLWIELVKPGSDEAMPLGLIEYSADDADLPEGKGHIITRIWSSSKQKDYTERIVHKGIEDYFRILCYPKQAIGMIIDLGNGPATDNGNRSSRYFTIIKGRQRIGGTVLVSLIEHVHELPEGKGFYTLRMVDDVGGDLGELYRTDDLSEDSLVGLLKEILDDLDKGGRK